MAETPGDDTQAQANEVSGAQDQPPMSRADLRRIRNRERTQKSRLAQRKNVERMKQTVQALTQELELLLRSQPLDRDTAMHAELPKATLYAALAYQEHRLKAEKRLLKTRLNRHENACQRLLDVLATDPDIIHSRSSQALAPSQADIAASFPEFRFVTLERARAAIASSFQSIAQCEQTARPLAHYVVGANLSAETFGWSVAFALQAGSFFYLARTKKLVGLSAQEAMQRYWAFMSQPHVGDESPSQRLAQSVLLQELDSCTCVVGNDWHHPLKPGVCMRSISVRTRRATERGFVVSLGTLNPQDPEQRCNGPEGVEYLDASNWFDFADEDDGSGCVATLKTHWRYDTYETLHARLVTALSTAWRWESEIIKHPVKLLTS